MRKVIGTTMAGAMFIGLSAGMVGCSDETGTKEEVKVTTPGWHDQGDEGDQGQKSGDNPPHGPFRHGETVTSTARSVRSLQL